MKTNRGTYIAWCVGLIIFLFLADTGRKAYAQEQRKKEIQEEESYQRPQPTRPVAPEIPDVNRYQDDKVFLEYADSLYKLNTRDTVERQILKGNVKFRQAGLWMFCDSAYYYPTENSLDAFSNVRMEQGDTLFVYADQLFYDGDNHLAKLKNGPTRDKVLLINKDVTLTTDSLDYDMSIDLGWYTRWGIIDDKVNTLTSLYGEYSPRTKRAEFFHDVVLVNNKDGFTMLTDTLYYNTETHIANIESRTIIQGENDTIITNLATYYTDTGDADLLSRSLIIHRDSTGNVTTLEGDSIIYDNATRISRAYMYQDPFKHSAPMVITDTAQKTTLIGGYGIYNDSTREALATIYPLLMEYSQGDTLFLRADTIKTFIVTEMIADKRRKTKSGYPEHNGLPIVIADSLGRGIWIDSTFFDVRIPYVETPLVMLLKAAPPYKKEKKEEYEVIPLQSDGLQDVIEILNRETEPTEIPELPLETTDSVTVVENFTLPSDTINGNDILTEVLDSIPKKGVEPGRGDSLIFPVNPEIQDTLLLGLDDKSISDTLNVQLEEHPVVDSIPVEYHVALAYHRARFFKQDMQGVADSMVFLERDSILYMFRKPIVWSEERQVTGNRIDVHFNDSTADWAYLPEYGLISELVDEDFYNQIFGKEITAYFEGQGLRRLSVSGNVETIFLPQEQDSTYNRLVNAESSYMEAYLDSNKLDWLKMWPEVSGSVTPIFLVKRNQMYLQKFKWWGFLRPEREWYGDRIKWADNLGEVPDELEQYFLAPSDFGEPKTFSGARFTPPPTSLPIWEDFPEAGINDSILNIPSELDSLIMDRPQLEIPDSIHLGKNRETLEEDSSETIEDILEQAQTEDNEAIKGEEEARDIEEEIEDARETGLLKPEEESNE